MRIRSAIRSLALLSACALAACGSSGGGHEIPYKPLHDVLRKMHDCDPETVMVVDLKLEPVRRPASLPPGLLMELRFDKDRTPVAVDAAGRFMPPLRDGAGLGEARLWVNAPDGVVGIHLGTWGRPPARTRITYDRLTESLPVMTCIVRGSQATAAPGQRSIGVVFHEPGNQSVAIGDGPARKVYSTGANGQIVVPFDPSLPGETPVEFSAVPEQLQPNVVDASAPAPEGRSLLK